MTISYIDPGEEEHPVEAEVGKNLLDVAHDNNIELEGMITNSFVEEAHILFARVNNLT